MRNSANVLSGLSKHSSQVGYKYERLYRLLFNEEMYHTAYQRIYAKEGNMTKGTDGKTIDGMSLDRINEIINLLRTEEYQPKPAKRVYIPKKNGKLRPLGIPSFDDKLVQEVLRMILESIYEGQFEDCSHGFRPRRSCHTALIQVQRRFTGVNWFIEGDIKGFFDNINHNVLIDILKERISDERIIRLIRKFLNAGYIENWTYNNTYSGTPQGGIISPLLANIYLDKLDKYIIEYTENYNTGRIRKPNKARVRLDKQKLKIKKQLNEVKTEEERCSIIKQLKQIDIARQQIPSSDCMDASYKRMQYVRYADDFLIGVIGSKEDSSKIKDDIKQFLEEKLKLELSEDKTLITHSEKYAKFLGYNILVNKSNLAKRDCIGRLTRVHNKKVLLHISMETIRKKLFEFGTLEIACQNGKEMWKPKMKGDICYKSDVEILQTYNYTLRGFHNYYAIANNSSVLGSFYHIMKHSMHKTFASKYRTTTKSIIRKYRKNQIFTVQYSDRNGKNRVVTLYKESFKRRELDNKYWIDEHPQLPYISKPSLVNRLKNEVCEKCGNTDNLQMHHVRKLSELDKDRVIDKIMLSKRRKTIALCKNCFSNI